MSGTALLQLQAHDLAVASIEVLDAQTIVSGGADGTLCVSLHGVHFLLCSDVRHSSHVCMIVLSLPARPEMEYLHGFANTVAQLAHWKRQGTVIQSACVVPTLIILQLIQPACLPCGADDWGSV